MWMTNRERHWRFVETELLPAFQLTVVATWLWLKVTDGGEPVSALVRTLGLNVHDLWDVRAPGAMPCHPC